MATITVRNLDDDVKELLRIAAARKGHSMEEEVQIPMGFWLRLIGAYYQVRIFPP